MIAGDQRSACKNIKKRLSLLADIGLFQNPLKSVLLNLGLDEIVILREA